MKRIAAALIVGMAALSNAHAAEINTMGQSGFSFTCLGTSSSCGQTFGQTFTVSSPETRLTSFTFALTDIAGSSLSMVFDLYAWNGSNKVGPALYQSEVRTFLDTGTAQTATFAPNVNLVNGNSYIAFLNTAGLGNSMSNSSGMFAISDSAYTGGTFLWERNAGDGIWNQFGYDSRFSATFVPAAAQVPEPATIALLGLGLLGVSRLRRKTK